MTQVCSTSHCEANKAYAIISNTSLLRITFSKSLADFILTLVPNTRLIKVQLFIGRELKQGEDSPNGLYAVCKANSGWPLRVTLFKQLASFWEDGSRNIREVWIKELI